jgi:hypothetical protein
MYQPLLRSIVLTSYKHLNILVLKGSKGITCVLDRFYDFQMRLKRLWRITSQTEKATGDIGFKGQIKANVNIKDFGNSSGCMMIRALENLRSASSAFVRFVSLP